MESDVGKLFIGGISWETSEETLKEHFSSYGEITDTVIMKDRATGRARGFGFVVFADPAVADKAVAEKHVIEGRTVCRPSPSLLLSVFMRSRSRGLFSR
jgi:RNA-binding protein Musashi